MTGRSFLKIASHVVDADFFYVQAAFLQFELMASAAGACSCMAAQVLL